MTEKRKPHRGTIYKICRFFAEAVYRGTRIEGVEKLKEKNTIIVANHAQLNGPMIGELFLPEDCYIWANGQMFKRGEVADYAMEDFFPYKKRWLRPLCRLASHLLSFLLPSIMSGARAIPVYRDARIVSTFKTTMKHLKDGDNILIFPECHERDNNILNKFQENFIDIARLYHRRCGVELNFLPMYIAPEMKLSVIGEGIRYNSENEPEAERHRISSYLSSEITRMGRELPSHTVIPFDNLNRKQYITNKDVDCLPG